MTRLLSVSIRQSYIKLETTLLFHVMAQHYWDTCDGARRAKGDPDVKPRTEGSKAMIMIRSGY